MKVYLSHCGSTSPWAPRCFVSPWVLQLPCAVSWPVFVFTGIEPGKLVLLAFCMLLEDSQDTLLWFPSGEQLLCEASTVLKCVQEDSCQRGIYGRLVCTDFKIAFLGDDESALDNDVRVSCTWLSLG